MRWTYEAVWWLGEIRKFIARDNPEAARRTAQGIHRVAQSLAGHPHRGYRLNTETEREVRAVLFGHYRIAYLVKEAGDVDILGIYHGSLDGDRLLKDPPIDR